MGSVCESCGNQNKKGISYKKEGNIIFFENMNLKK